MRCVERCKVAANCSEGRGLVLCSEEELLAAAGFFPVVEWLWQSRESVRWGCREEVVGVGSGWKNGRFLDREFVVVNV